MSSTWAKTYINRSQKCSIAHKFGTEVQWHLRSSWRFKQANDQNLPTSRNSQAIEKRHALKIFVNDSHHKLKGCIHVTRICQREKDQDLTQSYDENAYTNRKFNNQWKTQKRHQKFDYTTIAGRLRTVSWSNNSHQIGVVKPVYGYPTLPLTAKPV